MTLTIGLQSVLAAGLSSWHVILFFGVVLLLFGGKKLPELARGLAKGVRIFRDELHGTTKDIEDAVENPPPQAPQAKQDQAPVSQCSEKKV
jgi:sec-independent protein translocase protein TatA